MGGITIPPCAPTDLSNMRFYDALNGDAWLNNATLYGHVDFMNPDFVPTVVEVCLFNIPDKRAKAYLFN